ncbi:MAG: GHMP kinase [Candidatus Latescibacteria bacterium]|nr:GHMP kinase [Candidatus Latescibacterota bacterium]
MYQIIQGDSRNLADVTAFIDIVNGPEGQAFFDGDTVIVARAPGRLDVMGGIADYSGALVLEMPIQEATKVALQRDGSGMLNILSLAEDANDRLPDFEMPMADFDGLDYGQAQAYFKRDASRNWAAYVAGVFLVLMRERNVRFDGGVRLLIASDVPEGKGVSSSAAIEVSVMLAVAAAFDLDIEPRDVAILCQKVENLVVGAPCGVMDQMTSACAQAGDLLALLCQPAELQGSVSVPDEVTFWGLDSGIRHAVSGADYGSVRVGAFMGYRILADLAGLIVTNQQPVTVDDDIWHGYLANVTPSVFEQHYMMQLPDTITGADFLAQYEGTTDSITTIDPELTYAVKIPTRHPIEEHLRVQAFRRLLPEARDDQALHLLGEWMYQSHASYSACGLPMIVLLEAVLC